jgi:hypothetical protein
MAVVNTKASAITAGDTAGQLAKKNLQSGILKESAGLVAVANGDSIASTLRICRIPSSARVSRVLLNCTAITSAAGDIGLYATAADGGAVLDADLFASAQSLASALVNNTDVTYESGIITAADYEKPAWQLLGLTADPGKQYDVVITLTAAATAAGTASLKVQYVDGN